MRRGGFIGWWLAIGFIATARLALAVYEPERLENPTKRWAITVGFAGEYDDNINTASTNAQDSFRGRVSTVLQANLPREQSFFRMRYQYDANYTPDRVGQDKLDQAHSFDGLFSHTFTPRLVLNINDSVRRAVEPSLVDVEAGQSVELRRRGDYLFNSANANLAYNLSPRWTATVGSGWELWRYDTTVLTNIAGKTVNVGPSINDRDDYRGTLEVVYAFSRRTVGGFGYQLSVANYDMPGSNDLRNSVANVGYIAFRHSFNPQLSATANVGGEFREFGDGTQQTSPFINASMNYNFSRQGAVSLGFRYAIFATEVSTFRSTDTAQLYGTAHYQFTPKLRGAVHGSFSISTFQNPISVSSLPTPIPEEDAYQAGLQLTYLFTRWANSTLSYDYDRVISDFSDRSFSRNRVGLGVSLSY